jgi:hypothetical protein
MERNYRINELVDAGFGLKRTALIDLFAHEPGVLRKVNPRNRFGPIKRSYVTLLVPESVVARVKKKMMVQ